MVSYSRTCFELISLLAFASVCVCVCVILGYRGMCVGVILGYGCVGDVRVWGVCVMLGYRGVCVCVWV